MNITRALNDPKVFGRYFRAESWNCWKVFLAALFGLPLGPAEHEVFKQFTGRALAPSSPLQEAWLIVGRRGGKSFVLAVVATFLACFKDWRPYLGPGEVGTIMILARDRQQARVIKRFISGLLREVPMLRGTLVEESAERIHLKNRVIIEIHTASFRSTRGYTIVCALLDEISIWPTDETSSEPDIEVITALRPGMATIPGAMLLCASSPHARRGALWEAHRRHYGVDNDPVLVWQAPTRAMNATVPQSYIDQHMADDPARASAEYLAQFRVDVESYVSQEVVAAAVAAGRHELPRIEGVRYVGKTDPSGGSKDSMTLAISHAEKGAAGVTRAVLDLVREVRPPFSPDAVVAEFAAVLKSYGISTVGGDRYGGEWPRERFRVHGIEYVVAGKTASDYYGELLPLLNSGRVELLDHPRLIAQLSQLECRAASGGRDKIGHPPSGHDDVINAAALALVDALQVPWQEIPIPPAAAIGGFGTPRYVPGGSMYAGAAASSSAPIASYDYNTRTEWRDYVNADGSIRSTPRGPWDV